MLDELLDFWWARHFAGTCSAHAAKTNTTCPYCESNRTGRSIADLMED